MPELPEVETVANQIRPHIKGRFIHDFKIHSGGHTLLQGQSESFVKSSILRRQIADIERHGKYMFINFVDANTCIMLHLKMTGRFSVTDKLPDNHKHNRLSLSLHDGGVLNFIDTRRFAVFKVLSTKAKHEHIKKLGPDAVKNHTEVAAAIYRHLGRARPIYSTLMDQSVIAGLGNIYANEVLYLSKINPSRASNSLNMQSADLLSQNILGVLHTAINYKGTTLIDKSYADIKGDYGEFAYKLQVYGKAGKLCKNCAQAILKIKIAGRSVYYCANCQI